MAPNHLLISSTVHTNAQQSLHLRITDSQNIPSNPPSQPLTARWGSQAALVCPEALQAVDLLESERHIELINLGAHAGCVTGRLGNELSDEGGGNCGGVDADTDNSSCSSVGVAVHKMEFGASAGTGD